MKNIFTSIVFLALFINVNAQQNSSDFKTEIEKWKKELLLNGEVGPECIDPYQKWIEL